MKFDLNAPNPLAPFRRIPAGRILENTLKERLPEAAHMYNMMVLSDMSPNSGFSWFTLHGFNSPQCWILTTFCREDVGMEYSISGPKDAEITDEIKCALATSKLFDWRNNLMFSCIHVSLTPILTQISKEQKDFRQEIFHCRSSWMPPAEAAALQVQSEDPRVSVRSLKGDESAVAFLLSAWKYSKGGSEEMIRRLVADYPSAGVYLREESGEEELVSGVATKGAGTIGMLFTQPQYRQQGFAVLAMKSIMKQWADAGLIPKSTVVVDNEASIKFHEKLNLIFTHRVDYLEHSRISS